MKVYVVTDGDYSDYHIITIFSSKEKAEKFIKNYNGNIEEYELDAVTDQQLEGLTKYLVRMTKEGDLVEIYESDMDYLKGRDFRIDNDLTPTFDTDGNLYRYVIVKDKEHAIKIVGDYRRYLLANNLWKPK